MSVYGITRWRKFRCNVSNARQLFTDGRAVAKVGLMSREIGVITPGEQRLFFQHYVAVFCEVCTA